VAFDEVPLVCAAPRSLNWGAALLTTFPALIGHSEREAGGQRENKAESGMEREAGWEGEW